MKTREKSLEIRPVTLDDLDAILEVYRQCEDFLALGPVATASMGMVMQDILISQRAGSIFCGIYALDGKMVGIVDYVLSNYEGEPAQADLELLMIAAPYRNQGVGRAVVDAVEAEIRKDPQVTAILSGVQVNNPQAIQFWQARGYWIVGGPTLMFDQTTAYALQKDLK